MQKCIKSSVVAVAVAAALGFAGQAAAEATVYGKISVSAGAISQDVGGVSNSSTAISSHASRLGIKADKDLENGLKIVGVAEFEYDTVDGSYSSSKSTAYSNVAVGNPVTGTTTVTDTNTDTYIMKARNMYVGLKGGFGEVRVGNMDSPHKIATGNLDPFADTYADYNNIITVDNRLSNTMAYLNKFGPVSVAAAYHSGDDSVTGENNKSATAFMVNYDNNGLYLAVGMENYADAVAASDKKRATVAGAGYSFGPAKVGLVYEVLKYENQDDQKELYASASFKVTETGTINAAYGKIDNGISPKPAMAAIGYDYKMDKDANLYLLYTKGTDGGLANKAKLKGDGTAAVVGLVYKF